MDFGVPQQGIVINIQPLLIYFFASAFAFAFLVILKKAIKSFSARNKYHNNVIYLVRLPKEKPQDLNKEESLQQLHEEIARGETIFASIGGLRAQRGFKSWLFGRDDHFSFEIVANHKPTS